MALPKTDGGGAAIWGAEQWVEGSRKVMKQKLSDVDWTTIHCRTEQLFTAKILSLLHHLSKHGAVANIEVSRMHATKTKSNVTGRQVCKGGGVASDMVPLDIGIDSHSKTVYCSKKVWLMHSNAWKTYSHIQRNQHHIEKYCDKHFWPYRSAPHASETHQSGGVKLNNVYTQLQFKAWYQRWRKISIITDQS